MCTQFSRISDFTRIEMDVASAQKEISSMNGSVYDLNKMLLHAIRATPAKHSNRHSQRPMIVPPFFLDSLLAVFDDVGS